MRRCAFLSMDSLEGFVCRDDLLIEPLARLGWAAETVSWRTGGLDWSQYEAVIIRSAWDYQLDPERFMGVLEEIDRSPARLENALEIVKWNIRKDYLRDLESRGVPIVPTIWCAAGVDQIASAFERFGVQEVVVKPLVSANADNTFRLTPAALDEQYARLSRVFNDREFLVQPFMASIIDEGEYSLFFFAGEYSHAILKTPKAGDFRVQEEHGGLPRPVEPEPKLLALARQACDAIRPQPLYARLDFVRNGDSFGVMEAELIEPSLYFDMDPTAAGRFARRFDRWMKERC